jgi:hypothetical protein
MMMNIDEFMQLPKPEKAHRVLTQGRELLVRIYLYYTIKLYGYSGFLVEIWYLPAANKIDKIKIVDMEDVLHLYENDIDISDLFK